MADIVMSEVWSDMQAGMMREGWKKYQKSDATDRDVARHICFTHDYMYHVLDKSTLPGGRAIWINDLKGARMEQFHKHVPAATSHLLGMGDASRDDFGTHFGIGGPAVFMQLPECRVQRMYGMAVLK